jgi:hypothetical protein
MLILHWSCLGAVDIESFIYGPLLHLITKEPYLLSNPQTIY